MRRPANTAFRQQRLKAWQPILTPRIVIPTLFLLSIAVFLPSGILLLFASNSVSEITLDYTDCDRATETRAPLRRFDYRLKSGEGKLQYVAPTWAYNATSRRCSILFELPAEISHPVFLYYRLTNFYQNHRKYVMSFDAGQLKGENRSVAYLKKSSCQALAVEGDKPIYPCGLIANSVFNDTIGDPILLNVPGGSEAINKTHVFSAKGIAWPGERDKYKNDPDINWTDVVPPPNWRVRYPSYNDSADGHPSLQDDERFQNWMRTAGLPDFSKLYGRSDHETMEKGMYEITIDMNFPVREFGGTKSLVISNVSWIGGKNPFLAWSYISTSGLLLLLAFIATTYQCIKPRKLGDISLLSWN